MSSKYLHPKTVCFPTHFLGLVQTTVRGCSDGLCCSSDDTTVGLLELKIQEVTLAGDDDNLSN